MHCRLVYPIGEAKPSLALSAHWSTPNSLTCEFALHCTAALSQLIQVCGGNPTLSSELAQQRCVWPQCCDLLHCVAACCNMLHCVAACRTVLQLACCAHCDAADHESAPQHAAEPSSAHCRCVTDSRTAQRTPTMRDYLRHTALLRRLAQKSCLSIVQHGTAGVHCTAQRPLRPECAATVLQRILERSGTRIHGAASRFTCSAFVGLVQHVGANTVQHVATS